MEAHDAAVVSIARRVRQFYEAQKPFRIYHGSTNSTRPFQRQVDNSIDTSRLSHVLGVDKRRKVVVAEPNVPMDALVEATLQHGLIPPVVMEFPGITVGGGFSGTSGESSSFRYGAFDSTCNWIEIVLANGDITKASKTEKPDLFWGAASAFGTMGVVTLLEVQLIDAKSYVRLSYHLAPSISVARAKIQEETSKAANDYVDGIAYSTDATVICVGRLVDRLPEDQVARQFKRARDPWFYVHVQRILKELQAKPGLVLTDYVPLVDYLFRYDRGGFWVARWSFRYFVTPFNRITRFVLDPLLHTRVMYRALHKSGLADFYMLQDIAVPYDKVEQFAQWLDGNLHIYPLWLCPLKLSRDSPDSNHGLHSDFGNGDARELLNFGVWGPVSFNRREAVRKNRALEQKVHELGGRKWLYAHAYYTEDEFWAHYDRKSYDALRQKYSATYLPSVYEKVKVDVEAEEAAIRASRTVWLLALFWSIWPLRGLYGVYKAVVGGEYLPQARRSQYVQVSKKEN
jgi:FAD/FMN-containing dehydrogenase